MRIPTLVFAVLASFALAISAFAQDEAHQPKLSAFQFYTENDTYLQGDTSDEYYTNGIKIAWMYNPNRKDTPDWVDRLDEIFQVWCKTGLCADAGGDLGYGHAIGQNMYTPDSIIDPNPQPDDRPWAGYLYYSWILQFTQTTPEKKRDLQNLFEIQAGLVGPGAGARFAQSTIHKVIDSPEPLGWGNQIRNEPTLNLNYLWRKRIGGSTIDFVPRLGGGVGNVMTFASVGGTVRLGYHISGFPQILITPSNRPSGEEDEDPKRLEFFVFAGGEGRAVAHNIFLDGNSFQGGPEILIDRSRFVYDLNLGFAIRFKGWRLDYTVVERSSEFDAPRGRASGSHRYGAFALSWSLWGG